MWDKEVILRNGDMVTTVDNRSLPLKIMSQQEYNDLWSSIPYHQRKYIEVPILRSNGYACQVTDDFVACVGTGMMTGIPVGG